MHRRKTIGFVFYCLCWSMCFREGTAAEEWVALDSGVMYQSIGTWDSGKLGKVITTELAAFMDGSTLEPIHYAGKLAAPKFAVRLYKVSYPSRIPEKGNAPTMATGLIAVPITKAGPLPIVSYQHGTIFGRYECPSSPDNSMETKLMLAQFGSQGYIVISADYFGLGDNQEPNSYLMRESTEQACLDMLKASQQVLHSLDVAHGPLLLNGWSQGGYSTLAFLRRLEMEGISVQGASLSSSGGNMLLMVDRWMNNPQSTDAIWLPACATNLLHAAEHYWGMPGLTEEAIRPEYRAAAKEFFEFKINYSEYASKLPRTTAEVFRKEFLEGGRFIQQPFWQALNKAEAYQWRCETPLRIYYGDADEAIPQSIPQSTAQAHQLLGANTVAILNGPRADHRGNYVMSLLKIKPWFDELVK